jgi:hypothetical protein
MFIVFMIILGQDGGNKAGGKERANSQRSLNAIQSCGYDAPKRELEGDR